MHCRKPAGKKHIRVCRTLSCAMGGGYELRDAIARKQLGIDFEEMEAGFETSGAWRPGSTHAIGYHHVHNPGHGDPIAVSGNGEYSIEFVECLASCGSAPVAMVEDKFYENVRNGDIQQLLNGVTPLRCHALPRPHTAPEGKAARFCKHRPRRLEQQH